MYRLDLSYYYNGIRKGKVEVSGDRGVREIGQHTVMKKKKKKKKKKK